MFNKTERPDESAKLGRKQFTGSSKNVLKKIDVGQLVSLLKLPDFSKTEGV